MNKTLILLTALTAATACTPTAPSIDYGSTFEIDEATLRDKIRGGWAGQTIGGTYGGPTEFKYKGALISDEAPIVWYDD